MTTETTTETETSATNGKSNGSKQAVDAPRRNYFMMDPDDVVVVGHDTKDGPEHPLYDGRIKLPIEEALVRNIVTYGVIKPVLAEKDGDNVYTVDGRRRILHARAANERLAAAGEERIRVPVIFKKGTDAYLFGISRASNTLHADDGPLTNAKNAQRMIDMGSTEEEVAVTFGVKTQHVKDWLTLLGMAAKVRHAVEKGELSPSAAVSMASLPKDEQETMLDKLRAEGVKPTVDRVQNKKRAARGKEEVLSPRARIKKVGELLLKLGSVDATKDELIAGIDKISKALFAKSWDRLVAEVEAKEAAASKGKK